MGAARNIAIVMAVSQATIGAGHETDVGPRRLTKTMNRLDFTCNLARDAGRLAHSAFGRSARRSTAEYVALRDQSRALR